MPARSAQATPDVTVVVIAYNDAELLPVAVRSVTSQTLRSLEIVVVDDASTDGTGEVADQLALEDDRIRVIHLPVNSGGCSRPRNAGLENARAPYVMFLDSDDVYDRHACKNLLLDAEATGADVVAGQCVRVNRQKDRKAGWFTRLYAEHATFDGIRANPELFFDPLSTNKLYRRDFLDGNDIRFPEGVHYEDSLFTTKVYCQARRISVIPNVVYQWVVNQDVESPSITQRRFEFDNFRDRIAVHRMMDQFLVDHGSGDLKTEKDIKFLLHDLRLYLNDLPHRDLEYQQRFIELAADYIATIGPESLRRVDPVQRICVFMIRRLDIEETLKTVDYLKHGFQVSTDLVKRGRRVYWTDKYLDTPEGREVLDVTAMGLHRLPFDCQSVFNEVSRAELSGSRLTLEGTFINQFGQIPRDANLKLSVHVKNRPKGRRRDFPVNSWRHEGSRIHYSLELDLARAVIALDQASPIWDIRLGISWGGQVNTAPFSIDPWYVTGRKISLRARFGGLAPGTIEPYVTIKGNLAFRQVEEPGLRDWVGEAHRLEQRGGRWLRRRLRRLMSHSAAKARGYRLFQRLPVSKGLVVFESHMGKQYSDSPKYIFEEARAAGLLTTTLRPVWAYAKTTKGFPKDAHLVARGGWRYHYYLARAEFWVDNQGLPRHLSRRSGTTYIQTWHGTPLKRMGFDSPALEQASPAVKKVQKAMVKRWSALLAPSEYFVETFARSFDYDGPLVRHGLPRNDLLVRGIDREWVARKRAELHIPADRKIVLYAPTFRDRQRRLGQRYKLPLDLGLMQRSLAADHFLLVRTHYLDKLRLKGRHMSFVRDVSQYHDVTELMLIADVLITDYSSVMFDWANTGKPIVFYAYDYEEYIRDERGTYFDLADLAPGPLVSETEGLIAALQATEESETRYRARYATFRRRFCSYETGKAAQKIVAQFFANEGRS